jgi:membrane-associated protein
MHAILDAIQSLPPLVAYVIIAALVSGEAAIFIGFVLPGEAAVLLGGFLASTGHLNIEALCALVVVAAVVGDSIGYEVGKHFGPRVLSLSIFTRHQAKIDNAQRMLRERGGPAVFVGRFTALLRAVMPGLAGLSRMRYGRFLFWNALGGLVWGITFSLVGYFAGASYEKVAATIGRSSAIVLAVIVLALLVTWQVRRRRSQRSSAAAG